MPKKKAGKVKEKKEDKPPKADSELTKIKKELQEASKTKWVTIHLNVSF